MPVFPCRAGFPFHCSLFCSPDRQTVLVKHKHVDSYTSVCIMTCKLDPNGQTQNLFAYFCFTFIFHGVRTFEVSNTNQMLDVNCSYLIILNIRLCFWALSFLVKPQLRTVSVLGCVGQRNSKSENCALRLPTVAQSLKRATPGHMVKPILKGYSPGSHHLLLCSSGSPF